MKEIDPDEMISKAKGFSGKGEKWHHHFLPRSCMYNAMGRQFQIILENEETGESWVAVSYEKPLKWLGAIEDLQMKMNGIKA